MQLTARFNRALGYAEHVHHARVRADVGVPCVAYPLGVCSIVLGYGGNEEQAIAALLHAALEGEGGRRRLYEIEANFGDPVARIVAACTDAVGEPGPAWRPRKENYLARLSEHDDSIWLVACADKLHGARCIARDYRQTGDAVWRRFHGGGKAGLLWYYRALADEFKRLGAGPIAGELDRAVSEIEILVQRAA